MSKRLRLEHDYAEQLRQEAEEEDDKLKKQQERIFAPITWARFHNGFRIIDLKEKHFGDVIELIKEHYIPVEVLCRNAEIEEDEVSLKSFLDELMFNMRDSTSIIAIHESSNELAAVLILRIVNKIDYSRVFTRIAFNEGEARKKCTAIINALSRKNDVYKIMNCDTFLYYSLLCVNPTYRHKALGYQLMRIGLDVAVSLKVPVAMGIFSNFKMQKAARKLNFKLIQEVSYTNWRDKNNELIFGDPGAGNYSCALMICSVPPGGTTDPLVIKELSPAETRVVQPPRTRLEKRVKLERSKNPTSTTA
ncbi:PREDICTED: uncharacterized protein LOC108568666 [Nicrophorus vespilloides]|uniref:Uncharacterized protein LOC108568666 n=1 Tax=Nicrophorus vespilloides TaxID=110193 RepID=A0ABM1NEW1_NICVS|nr:PREDICTED: uncharacterized protein LOC108568666 [Nicrophorus vespilloides]